MFTSIADIDAIVEKVQGDQDEAHLDAHLAGHRQRLFSLTRQRINYYKFLYYLVQRRRPPCALELGVEFGLASAHMYEAGYGHTTIIGVDLNETCTFNGQVFPQLTQFHHFVQGDSTENETINRVRDIVMDRGKIGIVYQDSSHHYAASKKEFAEYSQMLEENAIWVCDDITPAFHDPLIDPPGKGMVQYWEELPGWKKLYPDVLHKGNTVGVCIL